MWMPWHSDGTLMSEMFRRPIPGAGLFDSSQDHGRHWVVRDREGVKGGTFFTSTEAMCFALSATGKPAHVLLSTAGDGNGRRRASYGWGIG
jgi:hypothetical protein